MLKQEFENIKGVTEQWLSERDTLIRRINELETKLAEMKNDNTNRAAFLEGEIERMTKEYNETLKKFNDDRQSYQKEFNNELKVNEKIRERHEGYIEILKKELILARNIIKTPVLLDQTYKKLNFDDVEFYRHDLVAKRDRDATTAETDFDILSGNETNNKKKQARKARLDFNRTSYNRPETTAATQYDDYTGGSTVPRQNVTRVQWKAVNASQQQSANSTLNQSSIMSP